MILTPELKWVYASSPTDRRDVDTIELAHPLFPRTYYLNNSGQAWSFLLTADAGAPTTFEPVNFSLQWPTRDGKGQQDAALAIDNVGREAMDAIEAASLDPTINITVTIRTYLDIANSAPQNDPPLVLALQSLVVTSSTIQGTATRADVLNRPFPTELYRVDTYPGLNR